MNQNGHCDQEEVDSTLMVAYSSYLILLLIGITIPCYIAFVMEVGVAGSLALGSYVCVLAYQYYHLVLHHCLDRYTVVTVVRVEAIRLGSFVRYSGSLVEYSGRWYKHLGSFAGSGNYPFDLS